MKRITINLLGAFEVHIDGQFVTTFEYAKVRALLAYLVIEAHRAHPRTQLALLLWPDQPDRTARASLSQALTTLRNALGEKSAEQPTLQSDTHSIQLDPQIPIEVDVAQFVGLLRVAETHQHQSWRVCTPCAERLTQAMRLYQGDFLADFHIPDSDVFEDWATLQREQLRQQARTALTRLIEWGHWCGAYPESVNYARQLVTLDPFIEEHQRTYMRSLALNGEISAALAQYKQLQNLLEHELDVQPEEATARIS